MDPENREGTSNPINQPADNPKRLATSDDIPRAVEKLLQWVIRLGFYGVATLCTCVVAAAFVWNWSPWLTATFAVVAVGAIVAGRVCGGPCPLVVTAPEQAQPPATKTNAGESVDVPPHAPEP